MTVFKSQRTFTLWDVNPTHLRLLFRSQKRDRDGNARNLDLQFHCVSYLDIPSDLRGVEVRIAEAEERQKVLSRLGRSFADDTVYAIDTGAERYYVVATSFHVDENDLPEMQSSILNNFSR